MPTRFMDGSYDPEAVKAMMIAFDAARKTLDLADTSDAAIDLLAKKIIEQARTGERDPARLCTLALKALHG